MKVLVIGLGSMGRRRIRLIRQYDSNIRICGVDSNENRRFEVGKEAGILTYETIEECLEGAEAAFVCTSPLSHSSIISECIKRGLHIFTELNLVSDGYRTNIELAKQHRCKLFLSSTFLYRDEIKYIDKKVSKLQGKVSYTYHVGQYLPDWHPWENIKDFFVGDRRTNGCREIFAIELPWIQKVFGAIKMVTVRKNKLTELEVNYNDCYHVTIQHKNGAVGQLAVDVVSRKPVRNLEVYGEELYLSWNGSADGLYEYDIETKDNKNILLYENVERVDGYSSFIIENAYFNEINAFFEYLNEGSSPIYGFEDDLITISWIDEIEE